MPVIPFSAKTVFFKAKVKILKGTAMVLPFPKPTLFSGPGSSLELCEAIAQMGTRRVLIVTDATLVKIGLIDGMQAKLAELGIEIFIYDGIEPDPTIDQIEAGSMIGVNFISSSDPETLTISLVTSSETMPLSVISMEVEAKK